MKVMVNGATGLVGLSVVKAFLEAGHEVRASDRPGSNFKELEALKLEIIPAELDDREGLKKTVAGMDVVVHVAGLFDFAASAEMLDRVNHQGTRNVCEAVLSAAPNLKRYIQIASVGVYGKPVKCPCREDDPKRPRNHYEKSKLAGENAAFEYHQKHGLPVTSLRPTLIYGPRARYGHAIFIATFCLYKLNLSSTLPSMWSGPTSSHVHVEDVGRAAVVVASNDQAVGRPFNIADPNPLTGPAFIRALTDPLGLKVLEILPNLSLFLAMFNGLVGVTPMAPRRYVNNLLERQWRKACDQHGLTNDLRLRLDRDWLGYMTGDNYYDVSALKDLGMDWKWPDAAAGLKSTIEWYREHEWIP